MPVFSKTCPTCGTVIETYKNPFPTVDVVLIRNGEVLLIERTNEPKGWALPGGFVDYGESVETAAARGLAEETGLKVQSLELLGVYSQPGRDPRFYTLSVVYLGRADGELAAGSDAEAAHWFPLNALPEQMAFDHRQIIADAARRRNAFD